MFRISFSRSPFLRRERSSGVGRVWFRPFPVVPVSFELNCGQADPAVRYLARSNGATAFLVDDGAVLVIQIGGVPSNGTIITVAQLTRISHRL